MSIQDNITTQPATETAHASFAKVANGYRAGPGGTPRSRLNWDDMTLLAREACDLLKIPYDWKTVHKSNS